MENEEAYKKAKERVEAKLGFYVHLCIYIVVNISLFIINKIASPDYSWFYWPLIGWGIGILFHGIGVLVAIGGISDRMIKKELKKIEKKGS